MRPRSQVSNADGRVWFLAWALRLVTHRRNLRSAIMRATFVSARLQLKGVKEEFLRPTRSSAIALRPAQLSEMRGFRATELIRDGQHRDD